MSNGGGRWGGRRGDHVRVNYDINELRERAIAVVSLEDDELRSACRDLQAFFGKANARKRRSKKTDDAA